MLGESHTLENADGSGEVVNTASGLQGSGQDLNGGNKIVGEAVVQVALRETIMLDMIFLVES